MKITRKFPTEKQEGYEDDFPSSTELLVTPIYVIGLSTITTSIITTIPLTPSSTFFVFKAGLRSL